MPINTVKPPPVAVDFKDSAYISELLVDAIEAFNQIALHRAGDDITNAYLALQNAGTTAYRAMECAYKNCLYRYYETKYQNGRMSEIDYQSKLRFRTAKGFKTHLDLKKDFIAITKPTPTVNLDMILKGASRYNNRIKHAAETSDEDFDGFLPILKEIILFFKTYISPDFSFPEPTLKFQRGNVAWENLKDNLHGFRDSCQYILVAPANLNVTMRNMNYLFSAPWHLVVDFNPASEEDGLKHVHLSTTQVPSNGRLLSFQAEPYQFSTVPHWIMANGFSDQENTVASSFIGWSRKYGQHLLKNLRVFKSNYPKYLQVVILPGLEDSYQRFIVEQFANLGVQSDGVTIEGVDIFLLDNHEQCLDLQEIMPDHLFCSSCSLEDMLDGLAADEQGLVLHTCRKELPHVDADDPQFPKLSADLETFCKPVYIGIEELEKDETSHVRDFYRGARAITWNELNSHMDLERNSYAESLDKLKDSLKQHPKAIYKIPYQAGSGASTLLRRIAWDLHTLYPTLMVEHYDSQCIHIFRSLQSKLNPGIPILILADCNYISESSVEEIRTDLTTNGISHVIIYVSRKKKHVQKFSLFDLSRLRLDGEVPKMVNLLRPHISSEEHANSLEAILSRFPEDSRYNPVDRGYIYEYTPFYIALAAFDKDFAGIGSHIAHHLDDLKQEEKAQLLYIALGNEINMNLNMEFFAYQMRRDLSSEAESLLRQRPAFEELVRYETDRGQRSCIIRYHRFAEEILIQVTAGKGATGINYIQLAEYIKQFISVSRPNNSITNNYIEDFLRAMLINRDPDIDARQPTFSKIITQIGTGTGVDPKRSWESQLTPAGRSAMSNVFQKLTELYPENTHFVAHRARYLYYVDKAYDDALRILEEALTLSESNGNIDSRLWHMKGMAYAARIANKHIEDIKKAFNDTRDIRACADLMIALRTDLRHAQEIFAHVRELVPSDISGYISEISLCVDIIEMGKKLENSDTATFLSNHRGDWYMDLVDRLNYLFDECEGLRDTLDESKEKYMEKTSREVNTIRKGIESTIQLYEEYLEEASEQEQPAVRRHLARAYMESKKMDSAEKWQRIVALMEHNMRAEPNNTANIRTWFKALIHVPSSNPSETLRQAVVRVNDWVTASGCNVEAHFYRYILTFLQAVEGITSAESYLPVYLAQLKNLTNNLPNKTSIRYWLGSEGEGLQRLIHKSDFKMDEVKLAKSRLHPLRGRVLSIVAPRHAYIRSYGAEIFFDPTATDGRITERDKNAAVVFGVGFSFDGPRAYNSSVEHSTSAQTISLNIGELTYGTRVTGMVTSNNGNHYITVDLTGYDAEGRLYISNLIEPYSDTDRPALGTVLPLSIVKSKWDTTRQGHRRLVWEVVMPTTEPAPEEPVGLTGSNRDKLQAMLDNMKL